MWFGDNTLALLGGGERVYLMGLSSVAILACLHVSAARGRSWWWLRWGAILVVVALLARVGAAELVLFMAGHLLAVLATTRLAVVRRPVGMGTRAFELLGIGIVLAAESAIVLNAPVTDPWRWSSMGAGAGVAAAIVDFGMTRNRLVWPALAYGVAALCLAELSAGFGYGKVLGVIDKLAGRYPGEENLYWQAAFGTLGYGTFCYWAWRLALRLSVRHSDLADAQVRWPKRLGTRFRRVLRLVIVWPALAALSLVIFTPAPEIYWRLPPVPPRSSWPPTGENVYGELLRFSDTLDWSEIPSRLGLDRENGSAPRFLEANYGKCCQFKELLKRPAWPKVDYRPNAPALAPGEEDAITDTTEALFLMALGAEETFQMTELLEVARMMLLWSRTFQRDGTIRHVALGRDPEYLALVTIYHFRATLSREQCQEFIALLLESSAHEESVTATARRNRDWAFASRGWRERIERAYYPPRADNDTDFSRSYDYFSKEHRAWRGTLICELALWHYLLDERKIPETLDELVPKYLAAIPIDPFGGKPFLYQIADDTIHGFVYSVGYNAKSDNGENVSGGPDDPDDISVAHDARQFFLQAR